MNEELRIKALEAKLYAFEREPATCNSGHTTLPLKLWDCPTCTEELRLQLGEIRRAVRALLSASRAGNVEATCIAWSDLEQIIDEKRAPRSYRARTT